jgi:3-hydroxyisobutyrate dehydrogenase-like beta-hydroxyacid dehydrogenase
VTAVAFIGLGAMGSRMARRLLDAGHEVVVWNRTRGKADELVGHGAVLARSPAAAAGDAEAVITMVSDPAALRAVTEGPDGVATGMKSSGVVIEMSTVGPAAVSRLASALPPGVDVLDAPVLGSVGEAEAGTLTIFVGGPPPLVQRWSPLLSHLGSPLHVGPIGSGAAAKLVANTTVLGVIGVLGEALALADGLGLSRGTAFEVLATTALGSQSEKRRASIESGEYPARYALSLARKDAGLILASAADAGTEMRLTAAAATWLAEAEDAGWSDRDYSVVLARILDSHQ